MAAREVNIRHFVKTAGLCLLLSHNTVQALSIGNIRTRSTLNQSFNADIVLSLAANENPSDVHVQLAPYDKFAEHGVPWSKDLLKLRFEPIKSDYHTVVIKVRSSGAISEPVLVFLLQARSQRGTIYRQFTVLLDPPASYEAPVRYKKQEEAREMPVIKPYRQSHNGYYNPTRERHVSPPPPSAPPPARRIRAVAPIPVVHHEAPKKSEWISVRNNDSLSKIAKRINVGASPEQMTIALYNANPRAFFSPNINALRAGEVLHVPERKAVLKLNALEARAEFYRQNHAWKERLSIPIEPKEAPPPPPEPVVAEAPVQKKLTLSAPSDNPADFTGLLLNDDINATLKPLNSMEVLNEKMQSLQDRLNKMENQMSEMQKLLQVKDSQLASLQNQINNQNNPSDQQSWFNRGLQMVMEFLNLNNKTLRYIAVGFAELLGFGLVAYYITKKTKKIQTNRQNTNTKRETRPSRRY